MIILAALLLFDFHYYYLFFNPVSLMRITLALNFLFISNIYVEVKNFCPSGPPLGSLGPSSTTQLYGVMICKVENEVAVLQGI